MPGVCHHEFGQIGHVLPGAFTDICPNYPGPEHLDCRASNHRPRPTRKDCCRERPRRQRLGYLLKADCSMRKPNRIPPLSVLHRARYEIPSPSVHRYQLHPHTRPHLVQTSFRAGHSSRWQPSLLFEPTLTTSAGARNRRKSSSSNFHISSPFTQEASPSPWRIDPIALTFEPTSLPRRWKNLP
jgi:hypothetical protein